MTPVEVPGGQFSGFGVTVEPNGERIVVGVDGDDGAKVAVEHVEPVLVSAAEDPVPCLKDPLTGFEGGSVETLRCGEVAVGFFVELGDGVVVGGDE
jgi:hypothetical protein